MIRVIVADDEQKVSQLICSLIEWDKLGMELAGVAQNGIEALALIKSEAPDLVISDIRMPGCDGLELVRRGKELNDALEFIIISGYRQFDYAQTALRFGVSDYLLKPINKEELMGTLEKMRIRHRFRTQQLTREEQLQFRLQSDIDKLRAGLFSLLLAKDTGDERALTAERINADYHFHLQPGIFQACIVKIDGDPDALQADGLTVIKEKSTHILRETLLPLCTEFAFGPNPYGILMVLNYPPEQQEAIRRQLRAALDELRLQNDIFPSLAFTIALGSPETEAQRLRHSLHIARFTAMQRLVEGTGGLLENLRPEETGADMQSLQEAGRALEAALEVMDTNTIAKALETFSRAVLSARQVTGQTILELAGALCSDYLMLARKAGLQLADADTLYDDFMRRAQLCSTGKMVLEALSTSILRSVSAALEEKRGEDTRPIRAAKQYIQDNYDKSITLEQVSAVAGFNASYFSSFFKKETGQNFLEYLSEVRINKAKELLRDSDVSIAKICGMVGYLDLKHFTKTFKKMTGVKPGEFRKLYS